MPAATTCCSNTDATIFTKWLAIVLDMVVPLLCFGFGYPKPIGPILDGYQNGFRGAHQPSLRTYPSKKVCDFSQGLAPPDVVRFVMGASQTLYEVTGR